MHRWSLAPSVAACLSACAAQALERHEFAERHMGTEFRLVLYAASREQAASAAAAAFARIGELDRELSDYDPESELSRLGRRSDAGAPTTAVPLGADLWRVLEQAQAVAVASGGAFDATVGPYVRLWRRAARQGELPDEERLREAGAAVGFRKLELDGERRSARLLAPGMRLDLGGIAKGFALDEALLALNERGIARALVVGGGELRAGGAPPDARGWRVSLSGLESSELRLELADAALATSGDLARHVELDGIRYSHIVDPRTGRALEERRLASVLAPDAMLADALATALSVLDADEGLELAARHPGVEARILVRRGERTEAFCSPRFPTALSCRVVPIPSGSP